MKSYHIAILGATGAVGQEMIHQLLKLDLPIKKLTLLASKRSHGSTITIDNQIFIIQEATPSSFEGVDIVLSAADEATTKTLVPYAVAQGAVVIDNSSIYRLHPEVPLCIPEINKEVLAQHKGIIANPNCATIIALMALYPLHKYAKLKSIVASTYQAVSGAGKEGIEELYSQIQNNETNHTKVFPYPIAYNIIPQIGSFSTNAYTTEELKLQNESRKILDLRDLQVNCTCVRIPVIRSHSISILAEFESYIDKEIAKELYQNQEGVILYDENTPLPYPMPLYTSNHNEVFVGRIRDDQSNHKHAISLWCCGDQLCKGAATNAVQIAKELISQYNISTHSE